MATLQEVTQLIKDGKLSDAREAIGEILASDQTNATAWALASRVTDDNAQKIQTLERAIVSAKASPSPDNQKAADWAGKELAKLRGTTGDTLGEVDGTKSKRRGWLMGCAIALVILCVVAGVGVYYAHYVYIDTTAKIGCELMEMPDKAYDCDQWLAEVKANHRAVYDQCASVGLFPQFDPLYACFLGNGVAASQLNSP